MLRIAPSVLAADFARLGEQVAEAEQAGAQLIHIDVMDGRFVPNISMGLVVVEAIRRSTSLPLDVHLMIIEPERYIEAFMAAGAHYLTVHAEATHHPHRAVQQIRQLGGRPGLALNPGTPLAALEALLPEVELALLMTVNPGFGGQRFIEGSWKRLEQLARLRQILNPDCLIEVDGGVGEANLVALAHAGVDIAVIGSAVFNSQASVAHNLGHFRRLLETAR
jgi:ribulose-phosphate 3-epimerase